MPRRPKGWTPDKFFNQREAQQRRPLAMNPSGAEPAQQNTPVTRTQRPTARPTDTPARSDIVPGGGLSYVEDRNGTYQPISSLINPKAKTPGIMESRLLRLGHRVARTIRGAKVERKHTPMGRLELVGTVSLAFRLINEDSSRTITVDVWRGEEQDGRVGLYFDPLNGSRFLEIEGHQHRFQGTVDQPGQNNATVPPVSLELSDPVSPPTPPGNIYDFNTDLTSNLPTAISSGNAPAAASPSSVFDIDYMVFPLNTWGTMSMAVLLSEASEPTPAGPTLPESTNPGSNTNTLNPVNQDDHLMTPLDFVAAFAPQGHQDHHMLAPDGFCPQCFNDACKEALVASASP
ncbi:Fc.00g040500.m01.CDS01 [Cosmosporella sp. VM-42]